MFPESSIAKVLMRHSCGAGSRLLSSFHEACFDLHFRTEKDYIFFNYCAIIINNAALRLKKGSEVAEI